MTNPKNPNRVSVSKNTFKLSLIWLFALTINSCTYNEINKESSTTSTTTSYDSRAFIAGIYLPGPGGAKIWNKGLATTLSDGDEATSVFISGSDMYAAGFRGKLTSGTEINGNCSGTCTYTNVAMYWKNGVPTEITDRMKGFAMANSIFVSGNDIYVAGQQSNAIINHGQGGNSFALSWKNGVADTLTDGMHYAEARSIFVSGSDVFVCGQDGNQYIAATAKYWKNGVAVNLTDGKQGAAASSIVVSNDDVYVAGFEGNTVNSVAKYWKNGVAVPLTDGSHWAEARSIFVVGSDVYVAGFDNYQAVYWKNGEKIILPDTATVSSAESMFVSGSDVYVVGNDNVNGAQFWKNGTAVNVSNQNNTMATAKSIFVAPSGLVPVNH
jgi:hypothetical protein